MNYCDNNGIMRPQSAKATKDAYPWTLSFMASRLGPIITTQSGRACFAGKTESGFSPACMHDDGSVSIQDDISDTDDVSLYTIIGYCVYHGIPMRDDGFGYLTKDPLEE